MKALANKVVMMSPLRDIFSVKYLYKPIVLDNIIKLHIFLWWSTDNSIHG